MNCPVDFRLHHDFYRSNREKVLPDGVDVHQMLNPSATGAFIFSAETPPIRTISSLIGTRAELDPTRIHDLQSIIRYTGRLSPPNLTGAPRKLSATVEGLNLR